MRISMYNITIPVFIKSLSNLSAILQKAEAEAKERSFDIDHLLNDRLAPDMLDFIHQVQIACDSAKNTGARLADAEAPKFDDDEKTVAELQKRIADTIAFLKTIRPEQIEGSEDKRVPVWFMPGKSLSGFEYVSELYLPNFFFHMTTAYDILRHNGITLGLGDFLGELSVKEEIEEKNK